MRHLKMFEGVEYKTKNYWIDWDKDSNCLDVYLGDMQLGAYVGWISSELVIEFSKGFVIKLSIDELDELREVLEIAKTHFETNKYNL